MIKGFVTLAASIIFSCNIFAQDKANAGEYVYSRQGYNEYIILKSNGQFDWGMNTEFLKLSITGNWQVRSDSLILDSYPQRDRLIVWEARQNISNTKFYVTNKKKENINYTFVAITIKNDTLVLLNQWKETILSNRISAFYIKDNKGLISPTYYIKGNKANRFYIYFETIRVFENESWGIRDDGIIPKGLDGTIQKKYILTKK